MPLDDEPISDPGNDRLGRVPLANTIAAEITATSREFGSVIALQGPWGSGKTSLIKMIETQLSSPARMRTVWFNPWLFSSTDVLIERFFTEVAAQLRGDSRDFSNVATAMSAYGDTLSPLHNVPFAGKPFAWISSAMRLPNEVQKVRIGSVDKQRDELSKKLLALDTKLLIVIDDIDRLEPDEMKDIFKLVRLTGNFPNVVYLLAFDRVRVEQTLKEQGFPGREYLKKIVQVRFDVPTVPRVVLRDEAIRSVIQALDAGPSEGFRTYSLWPDVFEDVVFPLLSNIRDVKQYSSAIRSSVIDLMPRVELFDILALEAIRTFLPDVFSNLSKYRYELTVPANRQSMFDLTAGERTKTAIETVCKQAGDSRPIVENLLAMLFPDAAKQIDRGQSRVQDPGEYLKDRRVAHIEVLSTYFDRYEGEGIKSFGVAEEAYSLLSDSAALDRFFHQMDANKWQDVIANLETFQNEFSPSSVVPASTVILNLLKAIPDREGGFLGFNTRTVIARSVLRLLRSLPNKGEIEAAVKEIFPNLRTMTAKMALLNIVGHEEGKGHELVGLEFSRELEIKLRSEIRSISLEALAEERDAYRVIYWAHSTATSDEPKPNNLVDAAIAPVLIKGAVVTSRTQESGTRHYTVEKIFDPVLLKEMVGGEEFVNAIVEMCNSLHSDDPELIEALNLADKYFAGEWPDRYRQVHGG